MTTLKWFHPTVPKCDQQGTGVSEQNFVDESRSDLEILIRELIQNTLDARDDEKTAVTLTIRGVTLNPDQKRYMDRVINSELLRRVEASSPANGDVHQSDTTALVIEDFGTRGLAGTYQDSTIDGDNENWNAFWFREGEGAKGDQSTNGGAGQGKITFYRMSAVRTVLGLTVRKGDGNALLMGRASFFRDYRLREGEVKSRRFGYWCIAGEESQPLPSSAPTEIEDFRAAFSLARRDEPGLSLVIPHPREYSREKALQAVLAEFFYPIACGRLVVHVDDTEVNADTVSALATQHLTDEIVTKDLGLCLTQGYRDFLKEIISSPAQPVIANDNWAKEGATLAAAHFAEGAVDAIRDRLTAGERVHVRFPIVVKRKGAAPVKTFLDVHVQTPDQLASIEEAYIRKDLLIGKEHRLDMASARHLPKSRSLTLISDDLLSRLMADAEEASHLVWNNKRQKLTANWTSGGDVVRQVRQAAYRLLSLLATSAGSRDVRALARYFSKPSPTGAQRGAGANAGKNPPTDPPTPPAPSPQLFTVTPSFTSVTIKGKGEPSIVGGSGKVELAYEQLEGNPFKEYDPFDFDIAIDKDNPVKVTGCTVTRRAQNQIEFDVTDANMVLEVGGFDPNIRLVTRLTFNEKSNGENNETE